MKINLVKTKHNTATVYVEPAGTAYVIPNISGGNVLEDIKEAYTDVTGLGQLSRLTEDVTAPGPSATEQEIQTLILEELKESGEMRDLLLPLMEEEMGIRRTVDAEGIASYERIPWEERVAGMTPIEQQQLGLQEQLLNQQFVSMGVNPTTMQGFTSDEERFSFMTPEQRSLYELQTLTSERELAALKGELPVSPALEKGLAELETTTLESLARTSGYGPSTARVQTLAELGTTKELTREAARTGTLGTTEALRTSLAGTSLAQQSFGLGAMEGLEQLLASGQQQTLSSFAGLPTGGYQAAQSYSGALQPYQLQRGMEFQANLQTAANRAGMLSGMTQLAGLAAFA